MRHPNRPAATLPAALPATLPAALPRRARRGLRVRRAAHRLSRADRAGLRWAARRRHPVADRVLIGLSAAADDGKLWYASAALLAATGKRRQRTAAGAGLLGLGLASALVNGPLKFVWRRDRPPTDAVAGPLLPLPRTYSFPSGHSASAFAFATGASVAMPAAAPVVVPLAAAVAYSRVHTGVHYPSDVLVGSAVGAAAGLLAGRIANQVRDSSVYPCDAPALEQAVPTRAVLVRSADSGSADRLDEARAVFERAGTVIEDEVDVADIGRLRKILDDAGDDPPLVVAAGGDGTVGCAAGIVVDTAAVLAIVPLGTSNDVARSLGIPPDAAEAARALVDGEVVAVDIGRVNLNGDPPRVFLNAATAGLNVAFAKIATTSSVRDRFGGLTYPVSAALALRRYRPFTCTFEIDGERRSLDLVHLSISNATVFGGVLGMRVPGSDMTDGLLDVIAIERLSVGRLLVALGGTVVGRHTPVRHVHSLQVRSMRVTATSAQQVAVDGEVVGDLPAEFSAVPAGLKVVVPPRP